MISSFSKLTEDVVYDRNKKTINEREGKISRDIKGKVVFEKREETVRLDRNWDWRVERLPVRHSYTYREGP